jgi:hypothetical protein
VGRQGATGVGGGMAAGRHRSAAGGGMSRRAAARALVCGGCRGGITGQAVVIQGRAYCSWDCALSTAGLIPGQYFG